MAHTPGRINTTQLRRLALEYERGLRGRQHRMSREAAARRAYWVLLRQELALLARLGRHSVVLERELFRLSTQQEG